MCNISCNGRNIVFQRKTLKSCTWQKLNPLDLEINALPLSYWETDSLSVYVSVNKSPRHFWDKALIIHWINFTVQIFYVWFLQIDMHIEDWRLEIWTWNLNGDLLMSFMNFQCLMKNLWIDIFVTVSHSGKSRTQSMTFMRWHKTRPDAISLRTYFMTTFIGFLIKIDWLVQLKQINVLIRSSYKIKWSL